MWSASWWTCWAASNPWFMVPCETASRPAFSIAIGGQLHEFVYCLLESIYLVSKSGGLTHLILVWKNVLHSIWLKFAHWSFPLLHILPCVCYLKTITPSHSSEAETCHFNQGLWVAKPLLVFLLLGNTLEDAEFSLKPLQEC